MRKNIKSLLSMLLVAAMTASMSLSYVHAESLDISGSSQAESIPKKDSVDNKEMTLADIMKERNPYHALGELEDSDKVLKALSEEDSYELMILMKYQYLKEDILDQSQSLQSYQDIVKNWNEKSIDNKEAENTEDKNKKEKYSKWEEEAFSLLPDEGIKYDKSGEKKKVTDFISYAEYLQSITTVDIDQFLKLLTAISDADSDEIFAKAVDSYEDYRNETYGFDESGEKEESDDETSKDKDESLSKSETGITADDQTGTTYEYTENNAKDSQENDSDNKSKINSADSEPDKSSNNAVIAEESNDSADEELKSSVGEDEKVSKETGKGVLVSVASRSIDKFETPDTIAKSFGLLRSLNNADAEEEKYYEVFAKVSDDDVDDVQVKVTIGNETTLYYADKGIYTADNTEYNWKLSIPYSQLDLVDTDGKIVSEVSALKNVTQTKDNEEIKDEENVIIPESETSDEETSEIKNKQVSTSGLTDKDSIELSTLSLAKKTVSLSTVSDDVAPTVVGTASTLASTASGVYNVAKSYLGSDFSILETNGNTTQVYYVYGTVYSSAYQYHKIWTNSISGKTYSYLTISSLDSTQATVRLRNNNTDNPGTWLCIYGKMTLNNLNIIGTGTGNSLGLVSAKNTSDVLSASEGVSSIYATDCTFSNNSKWAVHGDRNSYLSVNNCIIKNSQGGVGSHGQISVTNSTLDNMGGSYSGKAGIQLNMQINQTGFAHSMNLQNNTIKGFSMGVEYAISKYWPNNQIGGTYGTVTLTTTGSGNTVANCPVGIDINKYSGLANYMHITLGSVFSQVYGCTTGVLNTESHDTFNISGGNFRNNTRAINNAYTINFTGGNIYSNNSGGNSGDNSGAGVYNSDTATFNMSGGSIYSNTTSASGGGIYNAGKCTITSGEIRNNTSGKNGAGIANSGTLSLSGTSIYSNTASGSGGGLYNTGTTTLNSTSLASIMSDNTEIDSAGKLNVLSDTETDNLLLDSKSVMLYNNISAQAATNIARIGANYYTSLQNAVNAAGTGSTIYLLKNCSLDSTLLIKNKNLTICPDSSSITLSCNTDTWGVHIQNSKVTLSGNGNYTLSFDGKQKQTDSEGVIAISGNGSVVNLNSGLRIMNSLANGFVCNAGNTININSGFQSFSNEKSGIVCAGVANIAGGNLYKNGQDGLTMLANDGAKLNVTDGNFYNNGRAGIAFGAIDATGKDIVCYATLSKGKIYSNGIGLYLNTSNKNYWNVSNTGMSIYNNANTSSTQSVAGMGGGIHVNAKSVLTLSGGTIYSNSATGGGGGIYNAGTLTLNGTTIKNNSAGTGAGIHNTGTLTVSSGTLSGNTSSGHGGGIYNTNTLNMSGGYVTGNTSNANGGGIYIASGKLNITGGYIQNNIASTYGGGLCIASGTVSAFKNASVTGNSATLGGGMLTNIDTPLTSNTITGNKATGSTGGGVYINYKALSLTGNTINSNTAATSGGGVAGYQATINMKSGTVSGNTAGNFGGGISTGTDSNLTVSGGTIGNNVATNHNGGGIYITAGTGNITGGTITGNKATNDCGGGIFTNNGSTLNIKGGTISSNSAKWGGGVFNQYGGTTNMTGGTVTGNSASDRGGGFFNKASGSTKGVLSLTGGTISGNTSTNTGSGVVVQSTTNIGGAINIKSDNNVALFDGNYLNIASALTGSTPIMVVPNSYTNGSKIANVAYGTKLGSLMFSRFSLVNDNGFVIRPGNYQSSAAGTSKADIVVSSKYTIEYNSNVSVQNVTNMPDAGSKYWFESATIANNVPVNGSSDFKGWNENKDAKIGTYQAGTAIDAGINKDLTLYAIWDDRILVLYDGNQATSGTQQQEIVTESEANSTGGYLVRNNKGYTDYMRSAYGYVGWNSPKTKNINPSNVAAYKDGQNDYIPYSQLKSMATKPETVQTKSLLNFLTRTNAIGIFAQATGTEDTSSLPLVTMTATWDAVPKLSVKDKMYYEGQTVSRSDLLEGLYSEDNEDGILSDKVIITKIQYADGKLEGETKQKGETVTWQNGMPADATLDTWFLQMDKDDSPVVDKVTYQVTDSAGNVVEKTANIAVKYNEFPTIKTEDRYFTLDQAKAGEITEDELLKNAIKAGKVSADDTEEGNLSDKLTLVDFHPEEITAFKESGYILLTYHVQDSYGSEGKGKETTKQAVLYIIKDGVMPEVEKMQEVRFINEKYYDMNKDIDPDKLTEDEILKYNADGGLNVYSKWYRDADYRNLIESTFDKTGGTSYTFTLDDIKAIRKYADTYGIGNSKSLNALSNFYDQFMKSRELLLGKK